FPSARFKISSRIRAGKFSIFSSCRMSEPLSSRVNGDKRMTWRTPLPSFCCSTSNRRLSSSRAAHNTKRGTSLESGTNISKTSQDEGSHQCRSSQTKTNGSRWARWRTYPRNPSKIPDRSASLERNFTRSSVCVHWQLQQSSQERINLGLPVQAFLQCCRNFGLRRVRFDVQEAQHN